MAHNNISAIIFDLDGVLINSKDVAYHAFMTSYNEVVGDGQPPPFEEYCRYFGFGFPEIMKRMKLPAEMFPVFVRESTANMHRVKIFDGVEKMLEALSAHHIKMAIATGKDGKRTGQILNHLGIADYFSVVLGFDDVVKSKPAPDMAIQILETMDVDARETVFIGDAIADLECGRRAGTKVAIACWDNPAEEVLKQPADYVLHTPDQVVPILGIDNQARKQVRQ